MARNGVTVYLPEDLLARVRADAKSQHRSESSLVTEVVRIRYQRVANGSEEDVANRFASRLDARLEKLVGESLILKEIVLLFIQVWLKHNPALDDKIEESATASAEARFERFLDHVAQGLTPGNSLGAEVLSLDEPHVAAPIANGHTGVHPMSALGLTVTSARRRSALARALGPAIAEALDAPDVVEALVNADGRVWFDRVGSGIELSPHTLSAVDRETAIRLLAHEAGETVGADRPALATILPLSAARIQALLPPLVEAPVLAIRKRPSKIYTLADYVADGVASSSQAELLARAVTARRNIVVAGGTGSGKTTLLNALLAEPPFQRARVVILEDTAELQCTSPNCVQLLTKKTEPPVAMRELVQTTLRLRPDRIVVGEVRDGAALEVVKAWNTGHPGGLLSVHANSAVDALARLEDLTLESAAHAPRRLIASAVNLIVFIARTETGRRIEDMIEVRGLDGDGYTTGTPKQTHEEGE